MSRLSDYELRGLPQQAIDMLDDIRDIINNSKYQGSVATTGVPGWSANTGESAFFSSGSDRRLYLRTSTSWQLVAGFDPTLLPSALGTANAGTGNVFSLVDHIHTAGSTYLQQGSMQAFVTTGGSTWTRPAGITRVHIKVWGGGGGGGEGDGGGTPVNGTDGSSSSFAGGVTVSATGGSGGSFAASPGGAGSNGDVNGTGQSGQIGEPLTAGLLSAGGHGGAAVFGGAGGPGAMLGDVGYPGASPGGGGGGGSGGVARQGGGGGGGTGYAEGFISVSGNVAVTVGSGGTGGTGTAGLDGGNGANGLVLVYW